MPKSRKRPAAAAKASAARLRQPDGGSAGAPRWSTVPRATYGRSRPAPPPGKEWPRFSGPPWHTWMAMQAMQDCAPTQLALAEVTPWRIAPESDARAEWTSLAAEATGCGKSIPELAEEMADLEERGFLRWDQEHQTAELASRMGDLA